VRLQVLLQLFWQWGFRYPERYILWTQYRWYHISEWYFATQSDALASNNLDMKRNISAWLMGCSRVIICQITSLKRAIANKEDNIIIWWWALWKKNTQKQEKVIFVQQYYLQTWNKFNLIKSLYLLFDLQKRILYCSRNYIF